MGMQETVIEILKGIQDPEILIDVWTLGLIYDLKVDEPKGDVLITMTFTTPACPYGEILVEEIKQKVSEVKGLKHLKIDVVFSPPWQPSDEIKAMLGMG